MTTLYLVRHGETVENKRNILQGWMQGELTDLGRCQAESVAQQLADKHFDAFFSSDLKRAMDTCTIIAKPHGGEMVTTPLLRERDWGGFTGMFIPKLKTEVWPEDVETLIHLKQRARAFMEMLIEQYPEKCVLAVGHGIINKAIHSVYYNRAMSRIEKMQNGDVRIYELTEAAISRDT